jgi:hypothetical protein
MEAALMNSYILYLLDKKESGEKLQTHLSYRRNLTIQVVGNECEEQKFKKVGKTIIF